MSGGRRLLAALLIAPAASLAGCGSDRLSAKALHDRATVLCATAERHTDKIATPRDPAGGLVFLRRGLAVLDPELKGLRALKPPSEHAAAYGAATDLFARKLEALRVTVRELERGANPVSAMSTLEQRLAPIETAEDARWRALDIPACVNR